VRPPPSGSATAMMPDDGAPAGCAHPAGQQVGEDREPGAVNTARTSKHAARRSPARRAAARRARTACRPGVALAFDLGQGAVTKRSRRGPWRSRRLEHHGAAAPASDTQHGRSCSTCPSAQCSWVCRNGGRWVTTVPRIIRGSPLACCSANVISSTLHVPVVQI